MWRTLTFGLALVAAGDMPDCFSTDAPQMIEGKWWAVANPAAPASARAFVAFYRRRIRSDMCRDLLRGTRNMARTCSNMPAFKTLWWPSNCELKLSAVYTRVGQLHNRSASFFGDSLMGQLGHAVQCAAADTGLRVTKNEFGTEGLLPGRGEHHGDACALRAALEAADAAIVNVGAYYNLEPHCSATRLALPKAYPECGAASLARGARGDRGGYSSPERVLRGLNLRQDLHDDVARFFNLTKFDGAPHAWTGAGSRIAWRESLPQHYAGGTYSDSLFLHQNASCAPLDVAATAVARWRNEVTNSLASRRHLPFYFPCSFRQVPGPAGRGQCQTLPLTTLLGFCSCYFSSGDDATRVRGGPTSASSVRCRGAGGGLAPGPRRAAVVQDWTGAQLGGVRLHSLLPRLGGHGGAGCACAWMACVRVQRAPPVRSR